MVNALSLLPVGSKLHYGCCHGSVFNIRRPLILTCLSTSATDGGRIGLTLFGRPLKLVVGNLFLGALLLTGLLGSDLFLFYFSFIIAFQTGNEIPCRDETANVSFPRVVVATLAYCVAFLSLVPFQ